MDPSTSFVSIVGLLITFVQQRRDTKEAKEAQVIQDFVEWLRRKEHSEVLEAIESQKQLYESLDHLLRSGDQDIVSRLEVLNTNILQIMLHTQGWQDMARSMPLTRQLSRQALAILDNMEAIEATFVQEVLRTRDGSRCLFSDCGPIDIDEPRFLDDDLSHLVALGLLDERVTARGDTRYTITRLGSRVAGDRAASGTADAEQTRPRNRE